MKQAVTGQPDRCADASLLDIHVKGVEQETERWVIDCTNQFHRLLDGVEQARLEAIEWLDGEPDTG